MSLPVQDSACIAISHLAAICLRTPRLTRSPLVLRLLSPHPVPLLSPLSCCLRSHALPAPRFFFFSPRHSSPHGTWSRPAVTESHLVCSPLRLPDTQHPHRGLRWRQVEELMKPSALCMNTPLLSWQSANIWAHESLNYNSVRDCMWHPLNIYIWAPKHLFLPSLQMNHFDVMWDVLRARLTVEITGSIPVRQNNSQLHDLRWCWAVLNKKYLIDASTGKALKESVVFFTVLVLMNFMCMLLYTFTFHMVRLSFKKIMAQTNVDIYPTQIW